MFEIRLQTYWDDADAAGQVYFANFFRFVEYAETELFRAAGAERMALYEELNIWMPRVEAFAQFRKPIRAEEAVVVRIGSRFKGEKTVRFEFDILSVAGRVLLAEGHITAVCISRRDSKSCPIPPAMREILERAEVETETKDNLD
jgi:YbgC/YbaW family acyl-CoA thioester hydrolase